MPGPQGSGGPPGRKGPGRLRRLLTNLGQADPVGTGNTAEYQWGTHAVATHVAEALKSSVFRSLAAALPAAVPLFIFAAQQAFALPSTNFVTAPPTGATPQPIALTKGAPQYVDLTLQPSLSAPLCLAQGSTVRAFVGGPLPVDLTPPPQSFEPLAASQGRVPPLTAGVPQQDPTQLAAFFTPAQPAAATVPGVLAAFCSVQPQIEDRQMQIVWPAIMPEITPPPPAPPETPNTPGFRRLGRTQLNVEDEAEKLARRIREGTIKPLPVETPKDDSAYFKESARLAQAIATARADAETSRKAIARYTKQQELKAHSAKVEAKLIRAEQALLLARITEEALMEEMEVIDIAYLAVAVLSITLQ